MNRITELRVKERIKKIHRLLVNSLPSGNKSVFLAVNHLLYSLLLKSSLIRLKLKPQTVSGTSSQRSVTPTAWPNLVLKKRKMENCNPNSQRFHFDSSKISLKFSCSHNTPVGHLLVTSYWNMFHEFKTRLLLPSANANSHCTVVLGGGLKDYQWTPTFTLYQINIANKLRKNYVDKEANN